MKHFYYLIIGLLIIYLIGSFWRQLIERLLIFYHLMYQDLRNPNVFLLTLICSFERLLGSFYPKEMQTVNFGYYQSFCSVFLMILYHLITWILNLLDPTLMLLSLRLYLSFVRLFYFWFLPMLSRWVNWNICSFLICLKMCLLLSVNWYLMLVWL